jgi:hypothetical protein
MSVTVIEPATVTALTTLDRVRRELGIVADTDDLILDDLITRASSAIARETRRVFGIETVTETLDGSGTRLLGLSRTPILEITEVTEDSAEITDYLIEDDEAGALYRAAGWGRSGGLRMWGPLPGAVEQACLETVKAWYSSRDVDPSISSVKVGQLAVSYRDQSSSSTPMGSLPMAALGLLRNYYARPIA